MKYCLSLLMFILYLGCSSLKLTNEKLNPEFSNVRFKNILVIGVTPDDVLRKEFEFKFVRELNAYNINALQSSVVFGSFFKDSEQAEAEMQQQIDLLRLKGYDAILVTMVRGVDENTSYSGENVKFDYHMRKFLGYYLMYQKNTYDRQRYKDYNVYHVETSIYDLKRNSDMSLVWEGSYDLINSGDSHKIINQYIKKVIRLLEKEKLLKRK